MLVFLAFNFGSVADFCKANFPAPLASIVNGFVSQ